jgi:molecular chaperone GrpE
MTRRSAKPSVPEDPRRTAEGGRRGGTVPEPTSRESAGSNRAPDEDKEQLSLEDYNNLLEDYRRIAAEFDNYRKRQARDFNRLINQGRRQLVTELLAVLDNFDRARDTLDGKHPDSEIITGLIQIGNQIVSLLQKEGLAEVVTKEGDHFDPNIHEAMMAEDSEDGTVDEVMQVLQKGYRFGQDLIRPVRVKVSRGLKREVEDAGE